jgi:hypothetical protein
LIEPSDVGHLYLLRLTYKLKPIERQLPSARELKTRAEADLVKLFVDGLGSRKVHPDDLALARRLTTHEKGEAIIASLLRDHLGARPDAVEEATAARRAKAPTAARDERDERNERNESSERDERVRREAPPVSSRAGAPTFGKTASPANNRSAAPALNKAPRVKEQTTEKLFPLETSPPKAAALREDPESIRTHEPAPGSHAAAVPKAEAPLPVSSGAGAPNENTNASPDDDTTDDSEAIDENLAEIYVNVGRRDGAKPSDYEAALQGAGLTSDETDYIRVRHRHAFVGVKPELLEKALGALNGATIAGKKASAERARRV